MSYAASIASDRHPDRNEDSYVLMPEHGFAAVFDGLGGSSDGRQASNLAAAAGADQIAAGASAAIALEHARAQLISAKQQSDPDCDMGTTAAAVRIAGDQAEVAWVGDSRVYLLSGGQLRCLTADHDVLCFGVLSNQITAEEAAQIRAVVDAVGSREEAREQGGGTAEQLFRLRNRLFAELGYAGAPIDTITVPVAEGDLLVLTTDGVHDNLTQARMQQLADEHTPDQLAAALAAAALEHARSGADGRSKADDITCVVLPVPAR